MARSFVFVAYYWAPYVSGLTRHAGRAAEALAEDGHRVVVLTARHDSALPRVELSSGVEVHRLRVAARYDRAPLVPTLVPTYRRAIRDVDTAVLVLPLAEAALLAALTPREKLAAYYVCDPHVPAKALAGVATRFTDWSARRATARASLVAALSLDYARSSRVLATIADRVTELPPAIDLERFRHRPLACLAERLPPTDAQRVGFLGRLVHEKGLDVLIRAVALAGAPVQLLLAGDSAGVAGSGLRPQLAALARREHVDVQFLGPLTDAEVPEFLSALDVFVLPSVNSLEAWGMAQIEAMLCGTPVIASALPGVREIVRRTGMGRSAAVGDVDDLAAALREVLARPDDYRKSRDDVIASLGLDDLVERHVRALSAVGRDRSSPTRRGDVPRVAEPSRE